MLNDMAWRKTPRDLLTNPKIRFIASHTAPQIPPQAAFAFYGAVYMEADDDGVVDLGDKDVLADIIMIQNPDDIDGLTAAFVKRGFIEQMYPDDSERDSLYLIIDWDNPSMATWDGKKRIQETQAERRERILGKVKSSGRKSRTPRRPQEKEEQTPPPSPPPEVSAPQTAPGAGFFCAESLAASALECDKKSGNVTENEKPSFSVTESVQSVTEKDTPRERRDETRESSERIESLESKDTHTQIPARADCASASAPDVAPAASPSAPLPLPSENRGETERQRETGRDTESSDSADTGHNEEVKDCAEKNRDDSEMQETVSSQGNNENAEDSAENRRGEIPPAVAKRLIANKTYTSWQSAEVLYHFFKAHCPVQFERDEVQLDILQIIIQDAESMAEPKNPPYVIAATLCSQFLDLVNGRGYFAELPSDSKKFFGGMMIMPDMLKKPSVWPRIVDATKKKLSPGKVAAEKWQQQLRFYAGQVEKLPGTYNADGFIASECKKRGIDTTRPGYIYEYLDSVATEKQKKGVKSG